MARKRDIIVEEQNEFKFFGLSVTQLTIGYGAFLVL